MRRSLTSLTSLALALSLLLLAACADDGAEPDQGVKEAGLDAKVLDAKVDASVPDQAQPDQMPPDTVKPPKLTSTHSGWKKPLCFDCHDGTTAKYPHSGQSHKEPQCAVCHGYNGAPHKSHATPGNSGCMNCHASTTHASKFTVPDDCVDCHFHPGG